MKSALRRIYKLRAMLFAGCRACNVIIAFCGIGKLPGTRWGWMVIGWVDIERGHGQTKQLHGPRQDFTGLLHLCKHVRGWPVVRARCAEVALLSK